MPYQKDPIRIELFGDEIESIEFVDRLNYNLLRTVDNILIFPAKHFVTTEEKRNAAIALIKRDLDEALATLPVAPLRHRPVRPPPLHAIPSAP